MSGWVTKTKKDTHLRCLEYREFRAMREYTHTLRLTSELVDLRVGYANPSTCANANAVRFRRGIAKKQTAHLAMLENIGNFARCANIPTPCA